MDIKNIVNTEVYQIQNCADEPIHIPGSIQPHGVLLAVNEASGLIQFCSANVADFFGVGPAAVLNQPALDLFQEAWPQLLLHIEAQSAVPTPFLLHHNNLVFEMLYYRTNGCLVLELEPYTEATAGQRFFEQAVSLVKVIDEAKSLQALCQQVADETRRLTGYDRVMIYRFDKLWNGEVYAESKADGVEPLLGLHYPHTDIPAQARGLYTRKLVRLIADVGYTPVPLLTLNNTASDGLDLSDSGLRSVSPIHIQYLKNMNVGATLTISLLQDGRLWGLIACHHSRPRHLSYTQRQTALLQGHFLASQIRVRQVAEEYEVNIAVEAHLQQLLNGIEVEEDFDQKFTRFTSLLSVCNASGVAVMHNGELFTKGDVPPTDKVMALVRWLAGNVRSVAFTTAQLQSRYPEAESISKWAAGIIYHALGKPTENCIIWLRGEVQRTVNWAGDPRDAVKKSPVTNMLQPRSSFAIWKEQVRFQSREWRVSEVNAVSRFATSLQNQFHLLHLRSEEDRLRLMNQKLASANQELSNINWITSHDLKEPLRKIQIFASRIMDQDAGGLSETLRHSIARIQSSAARMQILVEDILTYSITSGQKNITGSVDLNTVLADAKDALAEERAAKEAIIESEALPTIEAVPHQMRQLFTNLLSNALKFTNGERPPVIQLSATRINGRNVQHTALPNQEFWAIRITDNGIGFDAAQGLKLFDIFYRLHSAEAYPGTGIGLAICKKIAENHNGAIEADGKPDEGAVFTVYLPV